MGDHTHGAGEFMLSYRYMVMTMAGNRDGTDGVDAEAVVAPDGYGFNVTPTEMPMQMHMAGAMYAPTRRPHPHGDAALHPCSTWTTSPAWVARSRRTPRASATSS